MKKSYAKRKLVAALIVAMALSLFSGNREPVAQAAEGGTITQAENVMVKLNKKSVSLYTSATIQLTATVTGSDSTITWKSSDASIAKVNSKGVVKGKKAGMATITAKANGVSAKCNVTVKKNPVSEVIHEVTYDSNYMCRYYIYGKNSSGITVWKYKSTKQMAAELDHVSYKVSGNDVYILDGKYFVLLNKATGKQLLKKNLGTTISGAVMYIASDGALYATCYYPYDDSGYMLYRITRSGSVKEKAIQTDCYWPCSISAKKSGSKTKITIQFEGGGTYGMGGTETVTFK